MCTLPHWQGCEGDIPIGAEAKGKKWAPCPGSRNSVTTTDDEFDDTKQSYDEDAESDRRICYPPHYRLLQLL